jgi:hypothetical protein
MPTSSLTAGLVASTHTNGKAHRCVVQGRVTTTAITIQRHPGLLTKRSRLERARSRECPRVRIVPPHRRSSVWSLTRSTYAPDGTTVSTRRRRSWRRTARGDQRARVSPWGKRLQVPSWSLPLARNAAATVRRPRARSVPVHTIIRVLQVGAGHRGRKTANTSRMGSGKSMGVLLRTIWLWLLLSSLSLVLFPTVDTVKLSSLLWGMKVTGWGRSSRGPSSEARAKKGWGAPNGWRTG